MFSRCCFFFFVFQPKINNILLLWLWHFFLSLIPFFWYRSSAFLALRMKLNLWYCILCCIPFFWEREGQRQRENVSGFGNAAKGRDVISCLAQTHGTCRVVQEYLSWCRQWKAAAEERTDDSPFRGVSVGGCVASFCRESWNIQTHVSRCDHIHGDVTIYMSTDLSVRPAK